MSVKSFAKEFIRTIKEIRDSGVESIRCENLISYLEEVEQSPEVEPTGASFEEYKAKLQNWVEAGRQTHERNLEMFKSVIAAGQGAIKTGFLLNGGAAVATLAFIGHLAQFAPSEIPGFSAAMLIFGFGALAIAATSGFTYLSQWFYAAPEAWKQKVGFALNVVCVLMGVGSYALFLIGLVFSSRQFSAFT
ncbi:hypothetical protein [Limibacillus sp. MBR-115]|jgi:hypothetical protein|uniref:hypothetical protein n=1 Tax=Limibacillus sp. MBR-115 TaxID=3156465 RepID=UPI003394B34F